RSLSLGSLQRKPGHASPSSIVSPNALVLQIVPVQVSLPELGATDPSFRSFALRFVPVGDQQKRFPLVRRTEQSTGVPSSQPCSVDVIARTHHRRRSWLTTAPLAGSCPVPGP